MSQRFRIYEPDFFQDPKLQIGSEALLIGPNVGLLTRVLRKKSGSDFEILDGKGQAGLCEIVSREADQLILVIKDLERHSPKAQQIYLNLASLKSDKLVWVTQKAVELGVSGIQIFNADHSIKPSHRKTCERLQKVAVESIRQCGERHLPSISCFKSLSEALPSVSDKNEVSYALCLDADVFSQPDFVAAKEAAQLSVWIGPEGDWSEREKGLLSERDIRGRNIHGNTLRSETAALAFVSFVSLLCFSQSAS